MTSSPSPRFGAWTRRRIWRWIAGVVTVCLVATAIGGYVTLRTTLDKMGHFSSVDNAHRPPRFTNSLNVLLLGSDTRSGQSASLGGRAGAGCNCSDTIMLAHISPGRGKVTVLSIPRDTEVPYYACEAVDGLPGQPASPYQNELINATLTNGGPECTRTTVEQLTGIYVNNVVQIDFTGFVKVIDDVGGVSICVPVAIRDPVVLTSSGEHGSGLVLSAGRHHIDGKTALKFWRARYALADGTDTARIARDQYLMAQVLKGVLRSGLLSSPTRLYRVASDTAASIATDASTSDLVSIASSLNGISSGNVQFVTAPNEPYPYDQNHLQFAQPNASYVFEAIAHDRTLPKLSAKKVTGPKLLTISPAKVKVTVLNGTRVPGLAGSTGSSLTSRGFSVISLGDTSAPTHTSSVIEYGRTADLPAANTLRLQFTSISTKLVPSVAPGTVVLILGTAGSALAPQSPRSASATPTAAATPVASGSPGASPSPGATSVSGLAQNYGGITGSVSCRDSAFFGTNLPAPTSTSGTTATTAAACPC